MRVLVTEAEIQRTVRRLAAEVQAAHGNKPLTVVGVMTGSVVVLADLIRQLTMPLRVGMVQVSSYRGGTVRGELSIRVESLLDIVGHHVLVVDEILDSGQTLQQLTECLWDFQPASIHSLVLMRKQGRQEVDFRPDFIGFEIPDEFVVGYGLDYRDEYRNLPYIAALEPVDLEQSAVKRP